MGEGTRPMYFSKILLWVAASVILLTVAQYGSVHLLNGRPSSWLFEASLDFGPPLLFAGDIVQLTLNKGYQGPIRDQPLALAAGILANIAMYGAIAVLIAWLFFPRKVSLSKSVQAVRR